MWKCILFFILVGVVTAQTCPVLQHGEGEVMRPTDQTENAFMGHYLKTKFNRVVAGAYGHSTWRGAVYVHRRLKNGTYVQEAMLQNPDGRSMDYLGLNVDTTQNRYIVAGAPFKKLNNNNSFPVGEAYIWERVGLNWTLISTFMAPDPTYEARFGYSVMINKDYVLIGARYATNDALNLTRAGAVYVYSGPKNNLQFVQKLVARERKKHWGDEVVMGGNVIIVGAPRQYGGKGAAFIFEKQSDGFFSETQILTHSPPAGVPLRKRDHFGEGIAITGSGDRLVIAGERASSPRCPSSGAAYVFERDANNRWTQQQGLFPSVCDDGRFGQRVATRGNSIIVGAWTTATDVENSGVAYIFNKCSNSTWVLQEKLSHPNAHEGDQYGRCVDFSSTHFVVGCPECSATGSGKHGAVYSYAYTTGTTVDDSVEIIHAGTVAADSYLTVPILYSTLKSDMSLILQIRNADNSKKLAISTDIAVPAGVEKTIFVGISMPSSVRAGDTATLRVHMKPVAGRYKDATAEDLTPVNVVSGAEMAGASIDDYVKIISTGAVTANSHLTVPILYSTVKSDMSLILQIRTADGSERLARSGETVVPAGLSQAINIGIHMPASLTAGSSATLRVHMKPVTGRYEDATAEEVVPVNVL